MAAGQGQLDAGPVPLVTWFALEGCYQPLGDYCIATGERARSIFMFSNRPIEALGGSVIGVTGETSTSVLLLKVLLAHRFQVEPRKYGTLGEFSDAFLLIGDEALRNRKGVLPYPYRYDLGEEWHRWTGLPFVFARWAVRRGLEPEIVERLSNQLNSSIDKGLADVDTIAKNRRDLGMSQDEVTEYVLSFNYHLGEKEYRSIELFRSFLDRGIKGGSESPMA